MKNSVEKLNDIHLNSRELHEVGLCPMGFRYGQAGKRGKA